jgi:Coiled-coil protein 142
MYLPILEATKDFEILNLTMKIICEAILEHIYNKQIKFSICGALNLLKDFEAIAEWIENSKEVPDAYR